MSPDRIPAFKKNLSSFEEFFLLPIEHQNAALTTLLEAGTERKALNQKLEKPPLFASKVEKERIKQANQNRIRDFEKGMAERYAERIDVNYWRGHGGNDDRTVIESTKFFNMITGHSAGEIQMAANTLRSQYVAGKPGVKLAI